MSAFLRCGHSSANRLALSVGFRSIWTSPARNESALASLRKKTGYALNLCKKALDQNQNDLSRAELWLKEEAIKNGWQKASQLQNRPAAEGLVGVYVNPNQESGILLEVNCETDFVSRNENFRSLVATLTQKVATASPINDPKSGTTSNPLSSLRKFVISEEELNVFKESLVSTITKLGENIRIRRAIWIQNDSLQKDSIKLMGYTHATGGMPNVHEGVSIGKYATLVSYKETPDLQDLIEAPLDNGAAKSSVAQKQPPETKEQNEEGEEDDLDDPGMSMDDTSKTQVVRLICQHIIGLKPTKLRKSREDLDFEESMKKKGLNYVDDDPDSLLDQKFLLNENMTVRQVLNQKGLQIVDFERFECGSRE